MPHSGLAAPRMLMALALFSGQAFAAELPPALTQQLNEFVTGVPTASPSATRVTFRLPGEPLPLCDGYQPFMAPNSRMSGRVSIGVRCTVPVAGGTAWVRYVEAEISVSGTYYSLTRPLQAGELIAPEDLIATDGDLSRLPRNIVTEKEALTGKIASYRISPGQPLRTDMVRSATVVRSGQNVKLVAGGPGFTVSSEGRALTSGVVGQMLQVRISASQVMTGMVQKDGTVIVSD